MFTAGMNLLDLTSEQLKRAASIKEQIAALNNELAKIFGISADGANNHRTMSAAAKKENCKRAESALGAASGR